MSLGLLGHMLEICTSKYRTLEQDMMSLLINEVMYMFGLSEQNRLSEHPSSSLFPKVFG